MINKMLQPKELTIIIVTYNSAQIIAKCLDSFDNSKYRVCVVDNASTDATLEIISKKFPLVQITKNNKNLGYGRANNLILKQCQTPFALVLNPDAILRDPDIATSLKHLKANPNIALASPKTVLEQEFNDNSRDYKNPIVLQHFIVGGILFMNIANVKKFGFFDEQFFMFAEDSDLCDRSIENGFNNAIFNDALTIHYGGKSSEKNLKTTYLRFWHLGWSKSKYRQKRKNRFNFIRSSIRLILVYLLESIFYYLRRNKEKSISKIAFCLGCGACLLGIKPVDKNGNPRGRL